MAQISILVHSATHLFVYKSLVPNTARAAAGQYAGPVLSPCPDSTCAPPSLPSFAPHCAPEAPSCSAQCWRGLLIPLGCSLSPLSDTLISHKPPCLLLCPHSAYLQHILSHHKALCSWFYGPLGLPSPWAHPQPLLQVSTQFSHQFCHFCLPFLLFQVSVISVTPFSDSPHSLQQCRRWVSTYRWSKWSNNVSDATGLRLCGEYRSLVWLQHIPPRSSLHKTRMVFSSAYLMDRGILSIQGDNGQGQLIAVFERNDPARKGLLYQFYSEDIRAERLRNYLRSTCYQC